MSGTRRSQTVRRCCCPRYCPSQRLPGTGSPTARRKPAGWMRRPRGRLLLLGVGPPLPAAAAAADLPLPLLLLRGGRRWLDVGASAPLAQELLLPPGHHCHCCWARRRLPAEHSTAAPPPRPLPAAAAWQGRRLSAPQVPGGPGRRHPAAPLCIPPAFLGYQGARVTAAASVGERRTHEATTLARDVVASHGLGEVKPMAPLERGPGLDRLARARAARPPECTATCGRRTKPRAVRIADPGASWHARPLT